MARGHGWLALLSDRGIRRLSRSRVLVRPPGGTPRLVQWYGPDGSGASRPDPQDGIAATIQPIFSRYYAIIQAAYGRTARGVRRRAARVGADTTLPAGGSDGQGN
ncbi:hypothetical protein F750_4628 [Streptomyces sp. PAMC 26508]|nr:hypothetical protein F750_4628 [Streptomyces sp. PAMC 26508]